MQSRYMNNTIGFLGSVSYNEKCNLHCRDFPGQIGIPWFRRPDTRERRRQRPAPTFWTQETEIDDFATRSDGIHLNLNV